MRAPSFWYHNGPLARLLSPLSAIGAAMTAQRVARPGWRAPVPVICCGNATVGGAGKTTLVLDLAQRLKQRGENVHILLRGYGGVSYGANRVRSDDPAVKVGDEALLLQEVAPTWVGGNRAVIARAAVADGATVLLMDDGLQNPTREKTCSLLVIDGPSGFGNGRVLPAGPLREPVAAAAARCQAAVMIGPDISQAAARLPAGMHVLRADLRQDDTVRQLAGQKVVAFAGIARPEKFFAPLREAGADLVLARPFPDHYHYSPTELAELAKKARHAEAVLVTTPKDAVRLPHAFLGICIVVGVSLVWQQPDQIDQLLDKVIAPHSPGMR
ncbi:MAG TPA: tetraacyldisaccharide 4'-kinase [Rhodopila sp.]|nr:tetraacyldisaccharide 4'-kinase [Rhodopila sp.]